MLATKLATRNLRTDRFTTICAILGVALGTATVNTVLILDVNTQAVESRDWSTNPNADTDLSGTVQLQARLRDGTLAKSQDATEETHEDYQVMRSAIRLGSLAAFAVGGLIVFFTFGVSVAQRRRTVALLRSMGAVRAQIAAILLLEAAIVGVAGGVLGYIASPVMAFIAAVGGISTTGRTRLYWLQFPWDSMFVVASVGALCAIVGVLLPLRSTLTTPVAAALRDEALPGPPKRWSLTPLALPMAALGYVLVRPFFSELLPSLAFFVLEVGAVCAAFFGSLLFVPPVVRFAGSVAVRLLPRAGQVAQHLLIRRRVENVGEVLAWSIGSVMLVFALLLSLHVVTHALVNEVEAWAAGAARPYTFVYQRWPRPIFVPKQPGLHAARFSARTPWPNAVYSVAGDELAGLAQTDETRAIADRLGAGKTILSTMMARRMGIGVGDTLRVADRDLAVVGITDDVGYVPAVGPYRNSKTYALIDASDHDLIAEYAGPIGAALAMTGAPDQEWLARLDEVRGIFVETGEAFEAARTKETNADFAIFDVILFLTTVLAAIGVANHLVLSIHGRRREIALYRVLGMTSAQIRRLFVLEGALIGLIGGPLAVVLGVPLGYAAVAALGAVSAFEVSFAMPAHYAVLTVLGATVVTITASLYPARTAAAASAADAVHYE